MYEHYSKTIELIADRLRGSLDGDIEGIYAFGSRARGDFDQHSDFDLLVVVRDKDPRKEDLIVDIIVETEMARDMNFTPLMKDAAAFRKEKEHNTPFYQNIMKDGIAF